MQIFMRRNNFYKNEKGVSRHAKFTNSLSFKTYFHKLDQNTGVNRKIHGEKKRHKNNKL